MAGEVFAAARLPCLLDAESELPASGEAPDEAPDEAFEAAELPGDADEPLSSFEAEVVLTWVDPALSEAADDFDAA